MLSDLTRRQEEYRGILRHLRAGGDMSYEDATLAAQGMDEDALVNVATVMFELSQGHEDKVPLQEDILWAQEFLDHLDSLGMRVTFKSGDTPM